MPDPNPSDKTIEKLELHWSSKDGGAFTMYSSNATPYTVKLEAYWQVMAQAVVIQGRHYSITIKKRPSDPDPAKQDRLDVIWSQADHGTITIEENLDQPKPVKLVWDLRRNWIPSYQEPQPGGAYDYAFTFYRR